MINSTRTFYLKSIKRQLHYSLPSLKIIPFLLADIGEGIAECEIVSWHVKQGDSVQQFSKICEVQSDKASVEITSRYDGVIKSINYKVGEIAKVGSALVDIDVPNNEEPEAQSLSTEKDDNSKLEQKLEEKEESRADLSSTEIETEKEYTLATPSVRRIAKENNMNLAEIKGSGPKGRILKGDVLAYLENEQTLTTSGSTGILLDLIE